MSLVAEEDVERQLETNASVSAHRAHVDGMGAVRRVRCDVGASQPLRHDGVPGEAMARKLFRLNYIHMSAGLITRRADEAVRGGTHWIDDLDDLYLSIRIYRP